MMDPLTLEMGTKNSKTAMLQHQEDSESDNEDRDDYSLSTSSGEQTEIKVLRQPPLTKKIVNLHRYRMETHKTKDTTYTTDPQLSTSRISISTKASSTSPKSTPTLSPTTVISNSFLPITSSTLKMRKSPDDVLSYRERDDSHMKLSEKEKHLKQKEKLLENQASLCLELGRQLTKRTKIPVETTQSRTKELLKATETYETKDERYMRDAIWSHLTSLESRIEKLQSDQDRDVAKKMLDTIENVKNKLDSLKDAFGRIVSSLQDNNMIKEELVIIREALSESVHQLHCIHNNHYLSKKRKIDHEKRQDSELFAYSSSLSKNHDTLDIDINNDSNPTTAESPFKKVRISLESD